MSSDPLSALDAFDDFGRVTDRSVYQPLPDDWWVGVTDVVDSTKAIEAGRYKAVNMAGAASISGVMNALGGEDFPFGFGGDGSQLAVPGEHANTVRDVLGRTARWTAEELALDLRVALIPVADIHAKPGREVLMAHYAPSQAVRYAMFAGGGVQWAEQQLKLGNYAVPPAAPGERPDLDGLTCRWKPMRARAGVMLSVIVRKPHKTAPKRFFAGVEQVLALLDENDRQGHPVPPDGPEIGSPVAGLDLEARAGGAGRKPPLWKARLFAWRIFAWAVLKSGIGPGGFDPQHYKSQTALNSDFRKFHDGLHMTVDCSHAQADAIEALLEQLERDGAVSFGIFRQRDALMTCIVPSYTSDSHLHFIDGAQGGYAEAARRLKG
ncbi:MAG: DUF3095 domain-containing protein [Hyphomicrobiales bacterium]|nr:DUF3095 domain-containing protein [Hyphomicrobiales bacterium]